MLPAAGGYQPRLYAGDPEGVDRVGVLLQAATVRVPGSGFGAGVATQVDVDTLQDVPAAVRVAAYFTVTESLTNIAKHSRATRAALRVHGAGDRLSIVVTDDGVGGADETRGTGLSGIRHRAHALDGTVTLTSPAGGPTTIIVELPCG